MDRLRDPFISIVLVVLIGLLCGVLAQKLLRRSWIADKLTGATSVMLTHILVGIAGAFIGFHAAMLTTASTVSPLAPFIAAAVVSMVLLWGWRSVRA